MRSDPTTKKEPITWERCFANAARHGISQEEAGDCELGRELCPDCVFLYPPPDEEMRRAGAPTLPGF